MSSTVLTTVLDAINDVFDALFYGNGSWFGLLLILTTCLGLMLKWKYSGALFLPVTIFVGIDYLNHNLPWHAIIIWSGSLILLLYMAKQLK